MKLLKVVLGLVVGFIVWLIVYNVITWGISFIAQIPFLGSILYYPSDSSWALLVLPSSTAVFAGAHCSVLLSGTAKPLCVGIILLYTISFLLLLLSGNFRWTALVVSAVTIVSACICFSAGEEA